MKKVLLCICTTFLVFSNINGQVFKSSNSIEPNATFIASKTVPNLDNDSFKDINLNVFYELVSIDLPSTKLSYSFEKKELNGKVFIFKSIYDTESKIKSISVSCDDSKYLNLKLQNFSNNTDLQSKQHYCTRILVDCLGWLVDVLFNKN